MRITADRDSMNSCNLGEEDIDEIRVDIAVEPS
jgi:hypothetical protein